MEYEVIKEGDSAYEVVDQAPFRGMGHALSIIPTINYAGIVVQRKKKGVKLTT